MSVVLVTGATGFLGTALVRVLGARGLEVHALARESSDGRGLGEERVTWHTGELNDRDSLERAASAARRRANELGVECHAIHSAAVISYKGGDRALQERVNVEGTANFLEACRNAGLRRFVHVSSVVAVGVAASAEEQLDETATYNGHELGCDYTDTKRAAEELVLGERSELEVVVVNPGAIYGRARTLSNTSRFLETLRLHPLVGRLAPPGSLSCVGVLDVAEGVALALERGRPGRRYLLTESNLRLGELYQRVAAHLGREGRARTVPPLAWRAALAVSRGVDRLRPADFATPQALRLLGAHFRFSSERARTELGWQPAPFEAVLRDTLEWLQQR